MLGNGTIRTPRSLPLGKLSIRTLRLGIECSRFWCISVFRGFERSGHRFRIVRSLLHLPSCQRSDDGARHLSLCSYAKRIRFRCNEHLRGHNSWSSHLFSSHRYVWLQHSRLLSKCVENERAKECYAIEVTRWHFL